MTRDRIIQLVAALVLVASSVASGRVLPAILDQSEAHLLRYTNVSVEGAPPWVALGTAIGAVRGLVVDILWMKIHIMKDKGLFYEVMADAELITKLQPRFAQVWAFHGHNMAYNISVATHTERERWEWVKAGIRLVRNEGLRHNPNDMVLHKELAFWHAHKIEGTSDDAHLYYKTEFTREWHFLLGEPPIDYETRIAWIKQIADAPSTLNEAERKYPGVQALVDLLEAELPKYAQEGAFALDRQFLEFYSQWRALKNQFGIARTLGYDQQVFDNSPIYRAFDEIVSNPEHERSRHVLIAHLRKRILIDEYNMDPQLMYEYTRDLGPIDWRHAQAHALYWSRKGTAAGEGRISKQNVYHQLNTDRLAIQGLQALARSGRISFDPFSNELPGRFPEPRFIDTIDTEFDRLYLKYWDTKGAGGETFIGFIENFLGSSIREWYRSGEREKAEKLYARLDSLFGRGAVPPNPQYSLPLDNFVRAQTEGQYETQPHLAPSDVAASLRYAFRVGVGRDNRELWEDAVKFANDVTTFFKGNDWNNYTNKFGRARLGELIGMLDNSLIFGLEQVMIDPSIPMRERAFIWSKVDEYEPTLRHEVYDRILPHLQQQFAGNVLSQRFTVSQIFQEPPNMAGFRQVQQQRQIERDQRINAERERDDISPGGSSSKGG